MYKQLFFLHKSENDVALPHFKDVILNHLKEISGKHMTIAKVESNLLLEQKYSYFFEVEFESKHKMNELMHTKSGKELTKALMDFHKMVTVISINYDTTE